MLGRFAAQFAAEVAKRILQEEKLFGEVAFPGGNAESEFELESVARLSEPREHLVAAKVDELHAGGRYHEVVELHVAGNDSVGVAIREKRFNFFDERGGKGRSEPASFQKFRDGNCFAQNASGKLFGDEECFRNFRKTAFPRPATEFENVFGVGPEKEGFYRTVEAENKEFAFEHDGRSRDFGFDDEALAFRRIHAVAENFPAAFEQDFSGGFKFGGKFFFGAKNFESVGG